MMPSMATTTPKLARPTLIQPPPWLAAAFMPTCQPIRATNKMLGPGADCASAIDEVNWLSLSQWVSSTRYRCMSGAVVMAPPTASSDSEAKCSNMLHQSAALRFKTGFMRSP